jgi:predicted DCC family thiol-disulfide oxidoreductase YuxK
MQYDKLIFFDGVCNLCNTTVQWIISHDPHAQFRFVALQSDKAQTILQHYGIQLDLHQLNTILFLQNDQLFQQSSAVLHICKNMAFPWKFLAILLVIPRFIRDFCYRIVAQNRYRWFGTAESCWLPTPALKKRFL